MLNSYHYTLSDGEDERDEERDERALRGRGAGV